MPKNLSHLSDAEIVTLMERYYAGEAVTKLLREYHLSVRANGLHMLFPPEICEEERCEYCGECLVRDRLAKTIVKWGHRNSEMYCPLCKHRPYGLGCKCSNCLEAERALVEQQKAQITDVYSRSRTPVAFVDLSFEQKVFLGALCKALSTEDLLEIKPLDEADISLAPTDDLRSQMYKSLSHDEIITVSPLSPIDAFVVDADDFPNRYYTYKVTYRINLSGASDRQALFDEILNPTFYSPEDEEDALLLWRKIAVGECLEYLDHQLKKVGFNFSPGEKTYRTFNTLLNDYSVSQVYGIIWKAVADASKLYLEGGISKKHAANTVIGTCERYAERAKLSGWTLTGYNRIKELPQSALSAFFFNRVLGIGDKGFKCPPNVEVL